MHRAGDLERFFLVYVRFQTQGERSTLPEERVSGQADDLLTVFAGAIEVLANDRGRLEEMSREVRAAYSGQLSG